MRASCPHCQRAFQIPEDRLPPGKEVSVVCPGCKGRFALSAPFASPVGKAVEGTEEPEDGVRPAGGEPPECLLCTFDRALGARVKAMLERVGIVPAVSRSPREAIDLLRFSGVPLVICEEGFAAGPEEDLWAWLARLSGEERRRLFAVLVGQGVASGDPMAALSRSADLVVDVKDLERLPQLFAAARAERDRLYQPLRTVLRELGLETAG